MTAAADITELARTAIDATKAAGPAALAAVALVALPLLATRAGRQSALLALRGLVGGRSSVGRAAAGGLAIPLLAVTAICASFALEDELRNGPNRMLASATGGGPARGVWLLQRGSNHFMNDSRLPLRLARRVRQVPGTQALWSQLSDIVTESGSRRAALVLARSDGPYRPSSRVPVRPGARCTGRARQCELQPGQVVVDPAVAPIAARLRLRERVLTVVGHFAQPASLLNRAVIAVHPTTFDHPDGVREAPYAIIATSTTAARRLAAAVAVDPERDAVELRDVSAIARANRSFWAGNGTPIMLLLILMIVAFGTVAYFAARRAAQEQSRTVLATLLAIGIRPELVALSEVAKALKSTALAGTLALPLTVAVVAAANSQILGFHARVTPTMLLAAMSLTAVVGAATAALLYVRLMRLDVPETMSS